MLGDPWVRVVDVYVPAGHDGEGLPLLVDLVDFTGSGLSHTNWVGFRENLPERLDRLIAEQRMPPLVVAFPDYFTHLGGKSIHQLFFRGRLGRLSAARHAAGNRAAPGCDGPGRRAVFGKSSRRVRCHYGRSAPL